MNEDIFYEDEYQYSIEWLHKNIPPDDIYEFCVQVLMTCGIFLEKLDASVDIDAEMEKDKIMKLSVENFIGLIKMRKVRYTNGIKMESMTK